MMDDQKNNKSRRGTMVVEAALILPLLLILTFGGIKYGWLFLKWQQLNNVARHSVRHCVRPSPDPAPSVLIDTLMNNAGMGTYTILQLTPNVDVGQEVVVEIQVNVSDVDILPLPLMQGFSPPTLTAKMTMSKEGP
ncbi:MAG: TadE/TadG family type IV pilus assembly protein [Planctomycetota bacterium]